jgi:type I restriction enzyme S subunit
MSRWGERKLGDLFELEGGFAFKSAEFRESGTPVIKIKNVKAGYFLDADFSYVDPRFCEERPKKIARIGDLLISMSGNRHDGSPETWVGKVAPFRKSETYLINQRVGALRPRDAGRIDASFFGYLLSSWGYQQHFISIATSSGGQANLSPNQILGVSVVVPSLPEQRAISSILRVLDDKVALNRRMNETLEGLARAIFKDWFIDFGPTRTKMDGKAPYLAPDVWSLFPDQLDQEGQPTGWTIRAVSEFADLKGGTQLAKERIFSDGEIPVFGGAGIMGFANDHNAEGFVIAVGRVGAYCGQFFHHQGRAWINNNASLVRPHPDTHAEWLFHSLRHADIETIKKGAAQPFVSNSDIGAMGLLWSSEELVRAYSQSVAPLILKSRRNQSETKTLTAIRDLLLPKLMSGEVQLKDAEQMTEAVM